MNRKFLFERNIQYSDEEELHKNTFLQTSVAISVFISTS